jgi:hypothetical protein
MRRMRVLALALSACAVVGFSTSCGGGGGSGGGGNGSLVALTTSSLPPATTGAPYAATFEATFPHPPGVFLVTGGSLPAGLSLDLQTGAVAGYPRQVGTFKFELAARDGPDEVQLGGELPQGRDASFAEARKVFTVDVAQGPPNILPQEVPAATYRHSYAYPIQVAGGRAPYVFSQTGGTLPPGLSIGTDGTIGTFPTEAQQAPYGVQVTVTDADGLSDTETLSVRVVVLPLIIYTSDPIPEAAVGFSYDLPLTLASQGGGEPFTWSQAPVGPGEVDLSTIGLQVTPTGHLTDLGSGPTDVGTFAFSVRVTDEPGQVETRALTLKVNPGPVVTSVTPNRASLPGPFTVTGLNFQPGAVVIFKPGATQTVVSPTFVSSTTLTFPSPVPKPLNAGGAVDVRVRNPDGGFFTKPTAFIFPAATLAFPTKGFVASTLSSTGLDAADVDGDGLADLVHSGASGVQPYSGGAASTAGGVHLLKNLGGNPPTFALTVLDTSNAYDVKLADVNVDGKLDVVALEQTTIKTWLNGVGSNPLGTFSPGPTSTLPSGFTYPSSTLAVGRLNSDLVPDLAFGVAHYPNSNVNGRLYTMTGDGSGAFTLLESHLTTLSNSYGVLALQLVDTDGDGRTEVAAGIGMNPFSGPMFKYASPTSTGVLSTWAARGGTITSPGYGSVTGIVPGDFLGNGTPAVVCLMSGAPSYSNFRRVDQFTGSGLSSQSTLANPPGAVMKCGTAIDGDFDTKIDFAVTLKDAQVTIWRQSSAGYALTLDATAGTPAVSSPKLGRIVSADVDGDGRPDLLATTSYWSAEGMASNYGSFYALGATGNGGSMGVVFWLNGSN